MEKALTAEALAYRYGYKDAFVREACMRDAEHHPLPHIKRGNSRPICYIQPETFEQWLKEEERLQVGLPMPDTEAQKAYYRTLELIRSIYEEQIA